MRLRYKRVKKLAEDAAGKSFEIETRSLNNRDPEAYMRARVRRISLSFALRKRNCIDKHVSNIYEYFHER